MERPQTPEKAYGQPPYTTGLTPQLPQSAGRRRSCRGATATRPRPTAPRRRRPTASRRPSGRRCPIKDAEGIAAPPPTEPELPVRGRPGALALGLARRGAAAAALKPVDRRLQQNFDKNDERDDGVPQRLRSAVDRHGHDAQDVRGQCGRALGGRARPRDEAPRGRRGGTPRRSTTASSRAPGRRRDRFIRPRVGGDGAVKSGRQGLLRHRRPPQTLGRDEGRGARKGAAACRACLRRWPSAASRPASRPTSRTRSAGAGLVASPSPSSREHTVSKPIQSKNKVVLLLRLNRPRARASPRLRPRPCSSPWMVALLLSRGDVGKPLGLFARVVIGRVVLAGDRRVGSSLWAGRPARAPARAARHSLVQCRA